MKFLRNYVIQIKTPYGEQITITPPITAQIDVTRNVMASANTVNVTFYNLAPNTRAYIYKDRFMYTQYWQMIIAAGYGDNLYEIFRGNIQEAYSYKRNADWITQINGYDGMYAMQSGFVSKTFSKGTSLTSMMGTAINALPNLLPGVLSATVLSGSIQRGQTFVGPAYDAVQTISGGQAYVDSEKVNVLGINEAINDGVFEINSDEIFESPRRRDTYLEVQVVFSPELRVSRICQLNSVVTRFTGQYIVYGFRHSVLISEARAGEATTMVDLFAGSAPFLLENAP